MFDHYNQIIRRFDLREVRDNGVALDTGRGERLTIKAWAPRAEQQKNVRWLSHTDMDTHHVHLTRVMAWTAPGIDAPHFVMELGQASDATGPMAVGTITLCPRTDLMMDDAYQKKYYGGAYDALRNTCAARPSWRHYMPDRADTKLLMGQTISYTFENSKKEIEYFHTMGARAVEWWKATLSDAGPATESTWQYDRRYRQALLEDPDNGIIVDMFGGDVITNVLHASSGWFGE